MIATRISRFIFLLVCTNIQRQIQNICGKLLWRPGVDINASIDGRLPIHYAADYGQTEVLSYLIEKGANIDAKDKHGISALLAAIWEGHTSCVKLMLDKGASKSGKTPDGVDYITAAEKPEIKELLRC